MKTMYSIIIVVVACVLVFFILKREKSETMTPNNYQSESTHLNNMNEQNKTAQNASSSGPKIGSDLLMTITKEGKGEEITKKGDVLVVNYAGYLADGTKFDASADHGSTFQFTLGAGQVIPGWDIGLVGMKKGEARRIVIPSRYAYGSQGVPGTIPANATLTFDVELVDINPTTANASSTAGN